VLVIAAQKTISAENSTHSPFWIALNFIKITPFVVGAFLSARRRAFTSSGERLGERKEKKNEEGKMKRNFISLGAMKRSCAPRPGVIMKKEIGGVYMEGVAGVRSSASAAGPVPGGGGAAPRHDLR